MPRDSQIRGECGDEFITVASLVLGKQWHGLNDSAGCTRRWANRDSVALFSLGKQVSTRRRGW